MSAARVFGLLALALSVLGAALPAQQTTDPTPSPGLARTVSLWAAVAHNALLKTRLGHRHDRDLYIVGIRAAWAAPTAHRVTLAYTIDLLPAVISTDMPQYHEAACTVEICPVLLAKRTASGAAASDPEYRLIANPRTVYGLGLAPVGLTAHVAVTPRFGIVAGASGGIIVFTKPVPDPGERRLNFTGDGRFGIELGITSALALSLSYHFSHISNGGAGRINPGMNSHMLELGITPMRH